MAKDKVVIKEEIFKADPAAYGPDYTSHLIEQYRMAVDAVDKTSERRSQANNFLMSINTGLIALTGFIIGDLTIIGALVWAIFMMLVGLILCNYWKTLLKSYQSLNRGKFTIIHEIEKVLPVSVFSSEWVVLGRGKVPEVHTPFTNTELLIPKLYTFFYVAITIMVIVTSLVIYFQTGDSTMPFPAKVEYMHIE